MLARDLYGKERRSEPTTIVLLALGKSVIERCIKTWFSETLSMRTQSEGMRDFAFLPLASYLASQINKSKMQLLNEFLVVLPTAIAVGQATPIPSLICLMMKDW